jgi:uncharacterized membrane protein YeaQ/YmgE (transglycosylase-associated protein family)
MVGAIVVGFIVGAIIGYLGRLLLPGHQNISALTTVLVGILAAVLGGIIATWLGIGETPGIDWLRHLIQIALAMFFVWLAARMSARRHTQAPRPRTP